MITTTSLTRHLGVTHQVKGLTGHAERIHPHLWTVRADFTGDPLPGEGMAVAPQGQADAFRKMLREYDMGHLNDLIGPGLPTMEGFGLHLMERCSQLSTLRRIIIFDAHHDPTEQKSFVVER